MTCKIIHAPSTSQKLDNFGNSGGYKANETYIPIYGNPILEN